MNQSKNKLTPIQILTCEKQKLMKQCDQQEQLIGEHITYIQQNAGSLIIKGVNSIMFPKNTPQKQSSSSLHNEDNGLNGYLDQIKGYVPMLWGVVRPILISWGMNKFRRSLITLLKKI